MSRTGLILRPVSAARVAHALGQNQDPGQILEIMLDLGRWVFVSAQHKRVTLVDLCRSADGLPDQLTAAGTRKQQKHYMLVVVLTYYVDNGWVVHVLPWVVGVRGLLDSRHINALLENTQETLADSGRENRALASARALYLMHRDRYGSSQGGQLVNQTLSCFRCPRSDFITSFEFPRQGTADSNH
jgi:hypothetical protein